MAFRLGIKNTIYDNKITLTPIESPNTAGNPTWFRSCPANKPAGIPAKLTAQSMKAILEILDERFCEIVTSAMKP